MIPLTVVFARNFLKFLHFNILSMWKGFSLMWWLKFLKGVVPISTCGISTLNWLTLTPKTHFHNFTSSLLFIFSPGTKTYMTLGITPLWKYIGKQKLIYWKKINFFDILPKFREFEAESLVLWWEKYGLPFDTKNNYFRLHPGGWECDWHKGL